jgi:alkylhydroperoxidase family enzyme
LALPELAISLLGSAVRVQVVSRLCRERLFVAAHESEPGKRQFAALPRFCLESEGLLPRLASSSGERTLGWTEALTSVATSRELRTTFMTKRDASEKEVADLSIAIAMINAWNRLASGARMEHPATGQRRPDS